MTRSALLPLLVLAVLPACARSEPAPSEAEPTAVDRAIVEAPGRPPSSSASTCSDEARSAAARAIELFRAAAPAEALASCDPTVMRCDPDAPDWNPTADPARCSLFTFASGEAWHVLALSPAIADAPTRLEVSLYPGVDEPRVDVAGSTWASVGDVHVRGEQGYAMHTHGGDPAWIGGARFTVHNLGDAPVAIEVTGVRWLESNDCGLPREPRATPEPAGLAIDDGLIDGAMRVEIPARTTQAVALGHQAQSAYMAWCDRFATAATFEIRGQRIEVIAEHEVTRMEPLEP